MRLPVGCVGPHPIGGVGEIMLTTTVDGLWVLQVLCGIETLAGELGLRPYLPRVEEVDVALAHPVADELRRAGVISGTADVAEPVREWLTVLARREVALFVYAQNSGDRILLARFAHWWVTLERCANVIRLGGAGRATDASSSARMVNAQIDRLCGQMRAAQMRPVTIDVENLMVCARDSEGLRKHLIRQGLDAGQVAVLTAAADPARARQSSIVAVRSGPRSHIDPCAVTIIDTPHGRLLSEQVSRGGKPWMIVAPGSPTAVESAVRTMLLRLPDQAARFSEGKAV